MLRAGIVALGRWGRRLVDSVQGDGVAPSQYIRFTRAYTRTPSKAADYMAARGLKPVSSYAEMLADPELDAVVLATPHSGHPEEVAAAAAAGRAVFCEKPFALTQVEAARAIAVCNAARIPLAVGHNRRFLPAVAEMKRRIAAGELGTLMHAEGNFSSPAGLEYDDHAWRANPAETPAGGLTLSGIHVIDALIGLMGPIESVSATSLRQVLKIDLDDTSAGMLRFRGGQSGYVSTITATARVWRLQVFGSRGWMHQVDPSRLEIGLLDKPVERLEFPEVDTERLELEAFARLVGSGESYPVPDSEVINGIGALEAFARSAAEDGLRVKVPAPAG